MKRLLKLLAICLAGTMFLVACGSSSNGEQTKESDDSQVQQDTVPVSTQNSADSVADTSLSVDDDTSDTTTEENKEETTVENLEEKVLDPTKPMIALTFDDGPNLVTTPEVLDLLEEYEITASFFLIGDNINMNTMKVVERAYNMGCEINNHSKTHSDMTKFTTEEIKEEIELTSKMIENITGEAPKFFRPPYISVNDTMYDSIDLTFICGHGCNDWEDTVTAKQRAEKVLEFADDGVIVLLHDSAYNSQTVEALKTIIPTLLDEGYQFVTVGQMFEAKGIELSADDKNLYTVVE